MKWKEFKRRWISWWRPPREKAGHGWAQAPLVQNEEEEMLFAPEWAEQLAFDAAVSRALQAEPVPAGLRAAILSQGPAKATRRSFRWARPFPLGIAAALILLFALPALFSGPTTFAQYRQQVVADAWTAREHLDFFATDLTQAQAWIKGRNAPWPTHFPKALEDAQVAGCRVFRSHGQAVTLICFANGMHHTHLFVLENPKLPDQPGEEFPQLATCQGWETASWSRGDQIFILSGLKSVAFLKQFRKEGHWSWRG